MEVENDLLPAQIGEPNRVAGVGRQLEIGCGLPSSTGAAAYRRHR
jgi:hypothetical protein